MPMLRQPCHHTQFRANRMPIDARQRRRCPEARPQPDAANGNGASHVLAENVPAAAGPPVRTRQDGSGRSIAVSTAVSWITPPTSSATAPFPSWPTASNRSSAASFGRCTRSDDGRFTKVANVVGDTMKYHPHGDASIGDALVVLANKRYLIEGQGNFGNIYTGDPAAAPRYIECRLTELARDRIVQRRDHRIRPELRRPQEGTGRAALQTAAAPDARHRRHRRRHVVAHPAAQFSRIAPGADRHPQETAVQSACPISRPAA